MRRYIVATILLLALTGIAHAAIPSDSPASERRTALVIGNSDYKLISPLRNPVNDARAMARVLSDLGFEVIAKENLDQKEMKRAIRDFGRKLGQGGVGLFFFAGHGVEVGGSNYLIPLNAPIKFEDDVDIEAVDVNMVLGKMASAANRLNIVILDACRNNPFARSFRSTARGLAQIDAPTGTLMAYAAKPGGVALDGDGENSIYTSALLEMLLIPSLKIEDVFKRVRVVVRDESGDQQIPWESSSLTGDFYFRLPAATAKAPADTSEAPSSVAERLFWQSIRNSANATEYHAYLRQYPDGSFAPLARIRLAVIEQAADEQAARKAAEEVRRNKAQAEEETRRKAAAEKGVQDAAELAFWESIQGSGVPADYQAYLEAFPTGQFAALAQVRAVVAALTPQQPSSERQGASISDFSGKWKGKGSLSKAAMYCPNTVSLEFEISDGVIEGQTKVRPGLQGRQGGGIKGSINATGKFEASDYYTGVGFLKFFGSVVAETGKGSGRWTLDIANELECKGSFEVSRVE